MNINSADTKGKILQTAIDIAGLKSEITIREIADKAGVNVAAINYHFGNKNNLLKEVENHYSAIIYNIQNNILMDENLEPREKLVKWAKSLMEFIFKYPALINLIVKLTVEDNGYNPGLVRKIYLNSEIQNTVINLIKKCSGNCDEKILDYKFTQLFSGILGPIISYIVRSIFSSEYKNMEKEINFEVNEYIEFLVDSVIK